MVIPRHDNKRKARARFATGLETLFDDLEKSAAAGNVTGTSGLQNPPQPLKDWQRPRTWSLRPKSPSKAMLIANDRVCANGSDHALEGQLG
jgi:hypothetical protein